MAARGRAGVSVTGRPLAPLVSIRNFKMTSVAPPDHWRPQTRGDCASVPRPCPYVGCRHHLDNDEHDAGHDVRITIDRLNEHRPSCSLDVAERVRVHKRDDGTTYAEPAVADLEEIKALLGLWHTGVEDALTSGLAKMAADPELREMFRDMIDQDRSHPLEAAQRWADAAPEVDE